MKILHTSDWHIGHTLYGKKRNDEHERFLRWLKDRICEREIGALIVCGDVFDNGAPGSAAQRIYYDFLTSLLNTCCKTVIIVAGNHDSPGLLEAPSGVLERLNIHTIGLPSEPSRHVIAIPDKDGSLGALCCAAPYLRKNDMIAGGDPISGDERIAKATAEFYRGVADEALRLRERLGPLPIIATGHLFAQGAAVTAGDGVRDLYVGSIGQVGVGVFPEEFDYVALGHIHSEQRVMGRENIRYCGSALHMSFSELEKKKYVLEVDLSSLKIEKIEVPVFQRMKALSGDHRTLLEELSRLRGEDVWIEAAYTGSDIIPSLSADIFAAVRGGKADVLGIRNDAILSNILEAASGETLDTLKVQDVFLRFLDANAVSGQYRKELIDCFNEIVSEMEDAV